MQKLIIAISNHLPDSQNRLNNFICSFTITAVLIQLVTALVSCNIFKNVGKIVNIYLYDFIALLLILCAAFIFDRAIKYLSSSKNTLNVLRDKEQINYDKQLLALDKLKWATIWTFLGIIVIITTFDYTAIIPMLFASICLTSIIYIIIQVGN